MRQRNQATRPRDLDPAHLAHALEPAERDEHALLAVVERERPAAVEDGEDVPRGVRTFADGVLRGRRHRPAGLGIEDRRAIAERPDAIEPRDGEGGVRADPSALVERLRPRRATTGCGALPTVLTTVAVAMIVPSSSSTRSASTRASRRFRTSWTPARGQVPRGMPAEAFPELGQDVCTAVDEDDRRLRQASRNVRRAVWRRSTSSAATSTPVDPPPTTTNVRSARCRSGSASCAASSSIDSAWFRR